MASGPAVAQVGFLQSIPTRVKLLILTQILNSFGLGYFLIYVSVYLPQVGISATVVGTVFGLEVAVAVCVGIPLGLLSDKKGRKWFLIMGNLLLAPALLVFAFTRQVGFFLVAAAIFGIAEAASLSSWNAMIADQTDLKNRDAAFALSFIVSNLFSGLGLALPFFFPALENVFGVASAGMHTDVLLVFGFGDFLAPLLIWRFLRNYKEKVSTSSEETERGNIRLLLKFSGINGLIGLGAGLIIPLVGTWLLYRFSVTDTYSGPFLAVSGMTIALAAVGSSRLSVRFGRLRSILMTSGSSTFFMFIMAFMPSAYLAGGVYIVRAALMNMSSPLLDSYLMGMVTPGRRGLASSISAIIWRLPNGVSSVAGGYLLSLGLSTGNHVFYEIPWVIASILYIVAIVLLYVNFKDVNPKG
jgi:MFS family permease